MAAIKISPNRHHFIDQQNRPFFWLGDTLWELTRLYTPADVRLMLETRKRQGFNVVQVMLTGVGDGTKPNFKGYIPWQDNNPASPNQEYFRQVDEIVRVAGECGMILCLGVFHQLQKKTITPANARAYAKWIAQRYRQFPHIVWSMYPEAKAEYVPVLQQLAAGLMEEDSHSHLITVHPDPSPTSSSFIHNEPWLDFNTIQTCVTYDLIYKMVSADYKLTPVKPVVMAEGGYEGKQFDRVHPPLAIRKQAWWTYLTGGYYSYGHNSNWEKPEPWQEWINTPGAKHMGVFKNIVTSLPNWWNIIPDQSIITDGQGHGFTLNTAGRSADNNWVLVYICSPGPVTLKTDATPASGRVNGVWISPVNGERAEIKNKPGPSPRSFSLPPGWEDGVLLVSK